MIQGYWTKKKIVYMCVLVIHIIHANMCSFKHSYRRSKLKNVKYTVNQRRFKY